MKGSLLASVLVLAAGPKPTVPQNVEQLYADFDPRRDPLEVKVVRQWAEQGAVLRHVLYTVGTFKGRKARMAAFYGFPKGGKGLPAVMHLHGGGQRAFLGEVRRYVTRGYACLSINWGGRAMEAAPADAPNTDWGAVDPTQNHVPGYSSLLPGPKTLGATPSPRNNNWYLLTLGARRGITFLERQGEVDANRIGVYGHSMGGRLTCLVAGSDGRVKAACPSVGGSGFLQTDLWGLPGSRRRVRGDLALFQRTIAGQAYLRRVRCPILWLGATNDFNSPMEFVVRGMALVPCENKRLAFAPHLNHRFTPEAAVCRPLWLDAHLKGDFLFPKAPRSTLLLKRDDGRPVLRVRPDPSQPIEHVDVYYGYGRDPRNRFWTDGRARRDGQTWQAVCPVMDVNEPLFTFANVYYKLTRRHGRDPASFALSTCQAAYPDELKHAGVRATEKRQRLIDNFARGWHDWYVLNGGNRHHWLFATHKPADPRWVGPKGAKLAFDIRTAEGGNVLAVKVITNQWRGYAGKQAATYVARASLPRAGRQRVTLAAEDFRTSEGVALDGWDEITELAFQAADKALPEAGLQPWRGPVPRFADLRWEGGRP
jgi:dienelactone hydrolase